MARSVNLGRVSRESGRTEAFVNFPPRTPIFDSDHPRRQIYLLRSGHVQVSTGREAIIDHVRPGDFFGEDMFLSERPSSTAKALTSIKAAVFGRSELLDRVQHDRRFALRLLKNLAGRLEARARTIRDFIVEPAERRLAWFLFRQTPAIAAQGWVRLRFSPSNSEMARTIGTTRSRISQFMGRFQRSGWLERRPEIWIRREGLRDYLGAAAKNAR